MKNRILAGALTVLFLTLLEGFDMKDWSDFGIHVPASAAGEFHTQCPRCSNSRKKKTVKCLSANTEKAVWCCHHCGWSGSLKEGQRNNSNPKYWQKKEYSKPDYKKSKLPDKVLEYFKTRGIPEEVLERNEIGYGKIYMPQEEDFVDAIQFPYRRNGAIVNVKYRDAKKNFRQEPNAERIPYRFNEAVDIDELIICEGEIDALSFEVVGLTAISVPDGAPPVNSKNYESMFDYLQPLQKTIETCKKVILAVDNDGPGQKLEGELARRIGKEKCWRLDYPEGCKDPNDILVKFGKEGLQKCYESVKPFPLEGIIKVSDIEKEINWLYQNGFEAGKRLGWPSLDDFYRAREGEVSVLTGIPSHGKTTWLDHVMINLAERYGWKFAVFTPENLPLQRHFASLAEKYIKKPFDRGFTTRMSQEEMRKALTFIKQHFQYIMPEEDFSLDNILTLAKACVYREGVKAVVLDPWNELEHKRPNGMTETEYISESLSKIRRFARLHEVHFWVVAHPTKLQKIIDKSGKATYPVPTPYDISGSSHWRNKADNCITVWRDLNLNNDLVEIHVQKIRFKENGQPGKIILKYDRPTGCFSE